MRQMCAIGMLFLIANSIIGCSSESGRLANMADRLVHSQNEVNANVTRTNEKFVELNNELQQERKALQEERLTLNHQFQKLEQDRRDLHRLRRSELAWSESFRFLAIVTAASMPLFLCAYLIWTATRSPANQEEVNSILLHELVSAEPRLIAAPNLPAITHARTDQPPNINDEIKNSINNSEAEQFRTS